MKMKKLVSLVVTGAMLVSFVGCAQISKFAKDYPEVLTGTLGAIIGLAVSDNSKGVILGLISGWVVGGAVKYVLSQSDSERIAEACLKGKSAHWKGEQGETINVSKTRVINKHNQLCRAAEVTVTQEDGTSGTRILQSCQDSMGKWEEPKVAVTANYGKSNIVMAGL